MRRYEGFRGWASRDKEGMVLVIIGCLVYNWKKLRVL